MQFGGSITNMRTNTGEGQEAGRSQQGEDVRAMTVKAEDREQRTQDALQEHAQKDACGLHKVRTCVLYVCQEQMTTQRFLCCVSQVIETTARCIHGFHSLRNNRGLKVFCKSFVKTFMCKTCVCINVQGQRDVCSASMRA